WGWRGPSSWWTAAACWGWWWCSAVGQRSRSGRQARLDIVCSSTVQGGAHMAKKNPISHVEWRTKDATRLQKFYSAVFNWKFKDSGMPGYTMVDFGNKEGGGGFFDVGSQPIPTGICAYATVQDLAPHEEAVKANGGTVLM